MYSEFMMHGRKNIKLDNYTRNITYHGKYCSVKLEAWDGGIAVGSGEKVCDRRQQ